MRAARGSRRSIWIAALVVFAGFFQGLASFSLGPGWISRFGLDDTSLSVIWACYIAGVVVALLAAPRLSARVGTKLVVLAGLAAALVGCCLLAFGETAAALAGGRLCAGVGTGVAASAALSGVLSLGTGALTRLAVSVASAATLAGAACGAAGSALVVAFSDQPDLVMFSIAGLVVIAALAAAAVTPYRASEGPNPPAVDPRTPRLRRSVIPVILLQVCVGAPSGIMLALGPVIVDRVGGDAGVDGGRIGLLAIALFGGTFVGQIVAQAVSVPMRRVGALVLTVLCCAAAVIAVPAGEPAFIIAAALATGVGSAMGQMAVFAEFRERRVGTALTAATSAGFLASYALNGALPIALGAIADATGDYGLALLVLLVVISILAAAATFAAARDRRL